MRYTIKNSRVVESIWTDAPYDTYEDARAALQSMTYFVERTYWGTYQVIGPDHNWSTCNRVKADTVCEYLNEMHKRKEVKE